jgi:hypothetical protein
VAYEFEWDQLKADSNLRKHGISFYEAVTAFRDPFAVLMPDPSHSLAEERYLVLGRTDNDRLVVVAFAERPPHTRIISARLAVRREHRFYEEAQD